MQISAGTVLVLYRNQIGDPYIADTRVITKANLLGPILTFGFFSLITLVFAVFLCRNWRHLDKEQYRAKYGNLYNTIDVRKPISLTYIIVYLARRQFFILITYALFDHPGI